MDLTKQELLEVMTCVKYYQNRHLSLRNPRYGEYEDILKKLHNSLQITNDHNN